MSERHSCIRPCASYVAGSFDGEDNNLTCHTEERMARLKNMLFRLELNISFLMSHMPGENERAVVTMKNFPCENYVTNDHKLNVIQAQTL